MRFERSPLSITPVVESSLCVFEPRVSPLMEAQIHAPIENAATPRQLYPADPSVALTAAIEARRESLVIPRRAPSPPIAMKIAEQTIGPLAREVAR